MEKGVLTMEWKIRWTAIIFLVVSVLALDAYRGNRQKNRELAQARIEQGVLYQKLLWTEGQLEESQRRNDLSNSANLGQMVRCFLTLDEKQCNQLLRWWEVYGYRMKFSHLYLKSGT